VSADVFGLSATHDLGIGQFPAQIGKVVDTIIGAQPKPALRSRIDAALARRG